MAYIILLYRDDKSDWLMWVYLFLYYFSDFRTRVYCKDASHARKCWETAQIRIFFSTGKSDTRKFAFRHSAFCLHLEMTFAKSLDWMNIIDRLARFSFDLQNRIIKDFTIYILKSYFVFLTNCFQIRF